ncbi:hypothetical protein C8J57DRAFT_1572592 [Mycena rebaudengoi]|nr:hypothetical protein C8J57DRAFT_1572592 [Mycena rebaudengoi]
MRGAMATKDTVKQDLERRSCSAHSSAGPERAVATHSVSLSAHTMLVLPPADRAARGLAHGAARRRLLTRSALSSASHCQTALLVGVPHTLAVCSKGSPHRRTPSIDDLKPNAHPYPIRTTSTALLTRSNSTSSQQNGGRHHYVPPPSPHPSPHRERTSSNVSASGDGNGGGSTGKAGGERRGEYRGHRYSRSLSPSEGMAYGGARAEGASGAAWVGCVSSLSLYSLSLIAFEPTDTTPDNKGIITTLSHKPWTPAWLAAYLGGEVGAWAAVHLYAWVRRSWEGLGEWFFLRYFLLFSPPFIYPRLSIPPFNLSPCLVLPVFWRFLLSAALRYRYPSGLPFARSYPSIQRCPGRVRRASRRLFFLDVPRGVFNALPPRSLLAIWEGRPRTR